MHPKPLCFSRRRKAWDQTEVPNFREGTPSLHKGYIILHERQALSKEHKATFNKNLMFNNASLGLGGGVARL